MNDRSIGRTTKFSPKLVISWISFQHHELRKIYIDRADIEQALAEMKLFQGSNRGYIANAWKQFRHKANFVIWRISAGSSLID
jgi:hypothetical protein